MLTILTTTEHRSEVDEAIASVDRLNELVEITESTDDIPVENKVLVVNAMIKATLDWRDSAPPYVFPEVDFSPECLLAYIFFHLGNHQKAFDYLDEAHTLYPHFLTATHLQFGYEISNEMVAFAEKTSKHNLAILHHYGVLETPSDFNTLREHYSEAVKKSRNDELKLFTAKHYLDLLMDAGLLKDAEAIIDAVSDKAISDAAQNAIDVHRASLLMAKLEIPYRMEDLDSLLALQQKCIAYFDAEKLNVQAGLLLIDAAEAANFKQDFILSKELINKAIKYFKQEDIPEFLGEAGLKKAILLYTWSKNGSPQYYKAAIAAFQDTLKIFKRDSHPKKFAEIHHNLGLIYSEIPVAPEEKPIWTAFSASSFKNALEVYSKEAYPYEFAMASHNYATALMDFPPAKIHDNLDKANKMFEEALEIRTAELYPLERALTLLNQLELHWLTHNENSDAETSKYRAMLGKIEEIKQLTTDENLLKQADTHQKRLEKLRQIIKL